MILRERQDGAITVGEEGLTDARKQIAVVKPRDRRAEEFVVVGNGDRVQIADLRALDIDHADILSGAGRYVTARVTRDIDRSRRLNR